MALEPVDVLVRDTASLLGIADVVVRAYALGGTRMYAEAHTDATGEVHLLLNGGTYQLRLYRFGMRASTQAIVVNSDPATPGETPNRFTVHAELPLALSPVDPRYCSLSGLFRTASGLPNQGMHIMLRPLHGDILVDGVYTTSEPVDVYVDMAGRGSAALLRGATYEVTLNGDTAGARKVRIPDAPTADLALLCMPLVASVSWVSFPAEMTVGASVTAAAVVRDLVGVPVAGFGEYDGAWASSNPAVLSVAVAENGIVLRALAPGVATVTYTRTDTDIRTLPDNGPVLFTGETVVT